MMNSSLVSRLTRSPRPYDPDVGQDAAAPFGDYPSELRALIAGAAGCSPYLAHLLRREEAWIKAALEAPEHALDIELAGLAALPPDQVGDGLRQGKRRVALLAGLADLGGVWDLDAVTGALTRLADQATDVAMKAALSHEIRRKKLPGMGEDDLATGCGMVALAMGKMGGFELNYSSDIDLICLFDETRFDGDDYLDARASLIRATRKMVSLLNDVTSEGYVFRTDLRLRPDPSVTPVCVPMAGAESYYESLGRTWERAAYIKARACAGDIAAGEGFLRTLRPFVWRKHLDFAAIQDAHDMRLRIREHKGLGGPITLPGHDMKLGRGGIREIEFFTQTRQLIAGGRDETLRTRRTIDGLGALSEAGWITADLRDTLADHYVFHREVEHRLQMVQDAQTQSLPSNEAGFDRLACFMDRDRADLERELHERLEEVHSKTEDFFAPGEERPKEVPEIDSEIIARWPNYPALRSSRATQIFNRLRPDILTRLSEAAEPKEALREFDAFLAGLPAGVQLFSLFEASPQLTQLLVDICATAPALAQYLSQHPGVLDAVLGGAFFGPWPGRDTLCEELRTRLAASPDYESRLDGARRWMKEWHFRIGVHHLRGLIDGAEAGQHYADLAAAVLGALYPVVEEEFARKYGPPPGRGAVVMAMGSLGAGRIHAQSDLDLIVIYDPLDAEMSDGPRSLATRPYYARLTQAFITAVTAQMAEGQLYEVDMRLRPSGRQGPVATSLIGFADYQRDEAWTWEHLALTRARVIAGDAGLAADLEQLRADIIASERARPSVRSDLQDMRSRIREAKAPDGPFDAKIGAGRLQDIELAAQAMALLSGDDARDMAAQLVAGQGAGLIDADAYTTLSQTAHHFWELQAAARLLAPGRLDPDQLGKGGVALLLRCWGADTLAQLQADIDARAARAAQCIDRLLEG